jgi:hypothetical protein
MCTEFPYLDIPGTDFDDLSNLNVTCSALNDAAKFHPDSPESGTL